MKKLLTLIILFAFCSLVVMTACQNDAATDASSNAEEASRPESALDPDALPEGSGDPSRDDGSQEDSIEPGVDSSAPDVTSSPDVESKAGGQSSEAEPVSSEAESSAPDASSDSPAESSAPDESSRIDEESSQGQVTPPPVEQKLTPPEVLYCAFSEKPYFAIIGRCADGATVYGEGGGYSFSSLSWHGWFSLRMKCDGGSVDVRIYQRADGKSSEPFVYTARPSTPDSSEGVVTGKNFQFFYQKNLPDYYKNNLPSKVQLDALTARVKTHLKTLRESNGKAEIIYMIVPASITVYPEAVPDEYVSPSGDSRLDKVIAAIRAGGATAIDLRSAFAKHKNDEMPLYYHLDSHWADYGGYIAYCELFDRIAKRFPSARPRGVEEFNWNPGYYESGDMPMYLSLPYADIKEYAYYRKFNFTAPGSVTEYTRYRRPTSLVYSELVTYENYIATNRSELPSCIVYRDSFGTQVYDILAERMNNTHYIGMWSYTWNANLIKSEKPDYVIYVLSEWNINSVLFN